MAVQPLVVPALEADGLPAGWPQDHGIPTLGTDVLVWSEVELAQPDGDRAGEHWEWRESQARFIAWWYAVNWSGRYLWRRGQVVLPKGAGKSPKAAAISCCELAGPVVFDGFNAYGDPVGRPHPSPLVQIAAVSQEQADNTYSLVAAMLRDGHAARTVPGLDVGLTRIRTAIGSLHPVTASAATREGQRITAAVLDEPHLWTATNGGHRLAATIRRNLGKTGGRSLETTNAWIPGELSVAEQTYNYAMDLLEGKLPNTAPGDHGVLRWHPYVQVDDLGDIVELRAALSTLYQDSPWIDVDRIVAEVMDVGTDPEDAQRFYLNLITQASDSWIGQSDWQGCYDPDARAEPGDIITLGFDGSRGKAKGKPDATALVACRVSDGYVWAVNVWEATDAERSRWHEWEPPITEIETTLADTFDQFRVVGFYADPAKDWRSYVNRWEARWGGNIPVKSSQNHPFEWWMTGGRAGQIQQAVLQLEGAIRNRDVKHHGGLSLTRHMLNARRRSVHGKLTLGKVSDFSDRKVDAAVATVLAWQARLDALAKGADQVKARRTFVPYRIR